MWKMTWMAAAAAAQLETSSAFFHHVLNKQIGLITAGILLRHLFNKQGNVGNEILMI